MSFPTALDDKTTPLTKELVGHGGVEAIDKLAVAGYEVQAGMTPEMADEITAMSYEPSIRKYCPKDCTERFKDRESTQAWLSKGRATFLLIRKFDRQLAGYAWVGLSKSEHVPHGETTFALRVGEDHQGHGLATPFSILALLAAKKLYGAENIWLETWASNEGAVHIYHKLGFVDTDHEAAELVSADGESQPDIRLYMILS